jgi:NitT/TauT family transport system permease protein
MPSTASQLLLGDGPLSQGPTGATIARTLSNVRPIAVSLLAGAAIWEVLSRALHVAFVPPLGAILQATGRLAANGEIFASLFASVETLAIGYGCAALAGVPVGLLLGRYRLLAYLLNPYFDALLAVPSILLVPILFGVFGMSRMTQVSAVFLYAFVVIAYVTRSGLATLDPAYVEMARAFGANERQILRRVLLPGTLPTVFAGLRLGIGRAVRGMVNVEMLVGPIGLGSLLRQYGMRFDAASVYGILIVIVALALAVNYAVIVADRRLNRWTY